LEDRALKIEQADVSTMMEPEETETIFYNSRSAECRLQSEVGVSVGASI
jgi:hypothetical protein